MALTVALTLACALALAGPEDDPLANTGTKRLPYAAREWLEVGLDVNGVSVDRLKLHQPGKIKGLFTKHHQANRGTIAVTNRTDRKVHPAVAIAVMDADGRLLAAANTGARLLSLKPGVTADFDIHLGGVFRHLRKGAHIYVSLEY